ncbi:MAG: indole-3-glycerol phosphate synthase TrpC [bacterium]
MSEDENILSRIMQERKKDVAAAKRKVSLNELLDEAEKRTVYFSLTQALRKSPVPRIIAEVKKASPSAGEIRPAYNPLAIAQAYASAGAAGISVLTEPHHFLGSPGDLRAVRKVVNLPLLRKDFICDTYQLAEAAAWGADVILLIVAALEPEQCQMYHQAALELNLETIVEVHTADELRVALACEGAIIGVNSRNLKTLVTDLAVAHELAKMIPDDRLSIAESGIRTAEDVRGLMGAGYDGFLIGESFLRETFPGKSLKKLLSQSQT